MCSCRHHLAEVVRVYAPAPCQRLHVSAEHCTAMACCLLPYHPARPIRYVCTYIYVYTYIVSQNCFYYTSKPECAIPDDNHTYIHIIAKLASLNTTALPCLDNSVSIRIYTYMYCMILDKCIHACIHIRAVPTLLSYTHIYIHAYMYCMHVCICVPQLVTMFTSSIVRSC